MGQRPLPVDLQRDAAKYKNLVSALDQATQEIRAMETAEIFDVNELLIRLLPNLARALDAERAFVAREEQRVEPNSPGQHELIVLACYPVDDELESHHLRANGLMLDVLESGRSRVKTSLGSYDDHLVAGLELFQAHSAVVVRMQTRTDTYLVGVCNERHPEEAPFLAADRMTLNYIVELAALNARASERRQQELEAIREIAECSANGSVKELYEVIVRWAVEVTETLYAAIWQFQNNTGSLHFQHAHHSRIARWRPHQPMLPIGSNSLNGFVAAQQKRWYADDVDNDPNYVRWDQETHSVFCVPLMIEDRLLGTLYVASDQVNGFSSDDQRFIEHLAPHAAIALHTARQQENRERVIKFQQTISNVLPLEEQLRQIRDELQRYVDTSGLFIARIDAQTHLTEFPLAYHHGKLAAWLDEVYEPALFTHKTGQPLWHGGNGL